jgi:hypothetical protein
LARVDRQDVDRSPYRLVVIEETGWFEYFVVGLVVGVPVLFGLGSMLAGVRRWLRFRRMARTGERVTAVVADNQMVAGAERRVRFLPVVQFRTACGQDVRAVLEDSPSNRSHLTEASIDVLYDPEDPRRVVQAGNRTGGGIAAIVVGLVFLAFGLVAYLLVSGSGFLDPQ